MKKIACLILLSLMIVPSIASAVAPPGAVGNIVLDVENRGEAWYVSPTTEDRFYLPNGAAAYQALREFGLGITNADLDKIAIANLSPDLLNVSDSDADGLDNHLERAIGTNPYDNDSDGDGFTDSAELAFGYNPLGEGAMPLDFDFSNNLKGRILIQVEDRGQAWYVRPSDGRRYYMKDGDSAYELMKHLGIGIASETLESINISDKEISCGDDFECFRRAVVNNARAETIQTGVIAIDYGVAARMIDYRGTAQLTVYPIETMTTPSIDLDITNVAYLYQNDWIGSNDINITCRPESKEMLLATLVKWNDQNYFAADYDGMNCEGM